MSYFQVDANRVSKIHKEVLGENMTWSLVQKYTLHDNSEFKVCNFKHDIIILNCMIF